MLSRREFLRLFSAFVSLPTALRSSGPRALASSFPPRRINIMPRENGWYAPFPSRRSVVYARHGLVAASQPLAAQAGLRVLQEGGNAADAAVAVAAMLNVVEPMSTGVGGDCFALYWDARTKRVTALNASGRAPRAASLEELRARGLTAMPLQGPLPVTVPGTVDGWAALLQVHGTMPLARVLAPAIAAAEEGYPVSELIAWGWQRSAERLKQVPSGQEFLPGGRAPSPGEIVRLPTLASTLRAIAEGGPDAFYRGPLARRIAEFVQAQGGWLTADDLAAHTSTWEQPIHIHYRGTTVYECPPNGQGLAALLALNIVEGYDLARLSPSSPDRWHLLIEAMRLAFADAQRYVADPVFSNIPLTGLLSKTYAEQRRRLISPTQAASQVTWGMPLEGDTVYLSVVDGQGNACSFINSLYYGFGSGLVVPGTGICLQNRGALFSLDPSHPNCLEPGKRPYHTIIPAMATRRGELWLCYGVMGGFMQPQGHLQVTVNMVDHGLDPQRALDAPRFCVLEGKRVAIEEGTSRALRAELARRGHEVAYATGPERALFGGGQVIARDPESGVLAAGSDPRKDGCAVGF
jgi:gamma-glutamyltranspeptidase/glutathione hydrolase